MFEGKDFSAYRDKGLESEFEAIGNYNLFMQCDSPNFEAFKRLPSGCSLRKCKRDELEIWKRVIAHERYVDYVTDYFMNVYAEHEDEFFDRCLFVCDARDTPIASCLLWHSYRRINTVGWLAVKPEHEGKGLGRALIGEVLKDALFPVYLHTQPTSARAIKLYSDFGFALVTDPEIGFRKNDLVKSLPFLQAVLPTADFKRLRFVKANDELLAAALLREVSEF